MKINLLIKIFLTATIFIACGLIVCAQNPREGNDPTKKMDLPDGFKESLAKRRIKAEEEEFKELVKRSEEAVKISDELTRKFSETQKFSSEDSKKIERLEKVVKKIRRDLGAEDDDDDEKLNSPSSLMTTLTDIKEKAANLLEELKKTGRFSISVVAVESSNAILKLVRLLRFSKT